MLYVGSFLLIVCAASTLGLLPFLIINERIELRTALIIGALVSVVILVCFISEGKRMFSRIIFSVEGIEWRYFKKQIKFFKWEEITDLKGGVFYRGDETIDIDVSKKMQHAALAMCPIPELKAKIESTDAMIAEEVSKYVEESMKKKTR